ncbi:hypothetical protein C8K30_1145 [Promicromonospora sp. AC04]|uniref:hypothetical protein n=1 Tax=Promicromonospora sp. AC04 TaxID=2135723 RepID=UPI000D348119|nr:hypothetical protein [Promicromonospora sp. AC04]PUB21462.1 hypothetical protein C8K30_1145 [Promicromonospora sp. AC04]
MDPRDYRMSRCTDPSNAPQQLHWAVVSDTRVERELVTAVLPHVPRAALPDAIADIKAVLQRITTCQAIDPDDVKNITRDRNLFEVRFQLESFGLLIRIYTAELPELPHHVLALHVHQKVIGVTDDETADLQNAEIDIASRRLALGHATRWGLP